MTTLELLALADAVKDQGHSRGHIESASINRESAWKLMNGTSNANLPLKERERCARRRALDAIEYSLGFLDRRAIEARHAVEAFEAN
jgi:hypothetical protein